MKDQSINIPKIRIEVNEGRLPAAFVAILSAVNVQQRLGFPAHIELTFSDANEFSGLQEYFTPGSDLRVNLEGFTETLFEGDITTLEWRYGSANRREFVVRGYDALHRLSLRQSMRAFSNLTPSDLARQLANGIGINHVSVPSEGPLWTRLYQHRQTDLALLQEVAGRCGLYPAVRTATLYLFTLAGDNSNLPLRLGENLVEAQIELNAITSYSSVDVVGWDPQRSIPIQARAGRSSLPDLAPGWSGSEMGVGGASRSLSDTPAVDYPQALAFAQAELDRSMATQAIFRGQAHGDPELQPGRSIRLEGLDASINGRYVLTEVNHSLNARQGFVSTFSTQPPQPPARARSAVATLGVVTQVNDPEKSGRVRVILPVYGDVETDWIGVLSAAAGPGKGLVALPNHGDTVLVLLVHEDPAQGLVLGGLYGQERLADDGVENDSVKRFSFRTAEGQLIQLDDQSLRLENRTGSFLELSPDRLRIFSRAPLTIEAPGNTVLIRASLIDFEQG